MKRFLSLLLLTAVLVLTFTSCGKKEGPILNETSAIMVNGVLYIYTGEVASNEPDSSLQCGFTTSVVESCELPTNDGETNFVCARQTRYVVLDEFHVAVFLDQQWYIFEYEWMKYMWEDMVDKPVIYLYPETATDVSVRLNYKGQLTCTYPAYHDGWNVTAYPDGTLSDAVGQTYNYLYWEGIDDTTYDFAEGFCVPGNETAAFLEKALHQLGLTRKEANEFIVYWLPQMQNNAYNLITFPTEAYSQTAELVIHPVPDTLLRVFMVWKPMETAVDISAQDLTAIPRTGFTVVEWGGSQVK